MIISFRFRVLIWNTKTIMWGRLCCRSRTAQSRRQWTSNDKSVRCHDVISARKQQHVTSYVCDVLLSSVCLSFAHDRRSQRLAPSTATDAHDDNTTDDVTRDSTTNDNPALTSSHARHGTHSPLTSSSRRLRRRRSTNLWHLLSQGARSSFIALKPRKASKKLVTAARFYTSIVGECFTFTRTWHAKILMKF